MKLFAFGIFMVCVFNSNAQYQYIKKWDKRYGGSMTDFMVSLKQTSDHGFILAGSSNSGIDGDKTEADWDAVTTTSDVWIVKIDSGGIKQWDKRFGGTNEDGSFRIEQTSDKGYAIGAITLSAQNGDKTEPSQGGWDYWLIKTDSNGIKQWDKRFGGFGDDNFWAVQQTMDKGYIVGGTSSSPVSGDKTQPNWGATDYWVVKTDSAGNKQWDKRFGGNDYDYMFDLVQCRDGGYLLGGYSSSDSSGDKTQPNWDWVHDNIWVIKINAQGNKEWDKRFGGTKGELFHAMQATTDNGFILGGSSWSGVSGDKTQASNGYYDYWVVKIDSIGNKQWDKGYGGTQEDELRYLSLTNDGGYLLSGNSESNAGGDKTENNTDNPQTWVVKLDSFGNKQWDKTIHVNGTAEVAGIVQAFDGCYLVGSSCGAGIGGEKSEASYGNPASYDYWVLKFCMEPFSDVNTPKSPKGDLIRVYPNPFTTDLSIALTGEHPTRAEFTITNPLGQTIYHQNESNLATGYTKMLDLSYLPNGLYFLEVEVDGERVVRQLVKE